MIPNFSTSQPGYSPRAMVFTLENDSGYAELHCLSNFTFLVGASHPEELVTRAAELGLSAIAITDHASLSGVVRAHLAAKAAHLPLVVGAEMIFADFPPLVLWVPSRQAYGQLARLITRGRLRAPKGECHLTFSDLVDHSNGLLAGLRITATRLSPEEYDSRHPNLPRLLAMFRDLFGARGYLLAERHLGADDAGHVARLRWLSRETQVPLVVANGVWFHEPNRKSTQDLLTATRLRRPVAEVLGQLAPNRERYLKAPAAMAELWPDFPDALKRSDEIARACTFSLDELRYEYPIDVCPPGQNAHSFLRQLVEAGGRERYPTGVPEKVQKLIEHELRLIAEMDYAPYFLTVWDLVRFARSRGILCQGRGSAANSAVCYCLGVTPVDPDRIDVLFERFISKERNEPPDIDVDFEHQRREEVLQYIYAKYGWERVGMTAEVVTYQTRSTIRDVGKAMGLSLDRVDRLAKYVDSHGSTDGAMLARACTAVGLDPHAELGRGFIHFVQTIVGFPRHLSQHVGGMVIARGPLCELVPIENAAMAGRTVLQWNKDDLDALGVLKIDCLALGMLSAIHRAFDLVEKHYQRPLDLHTIPPEDARVYSMIQAADTVGVFQIESRAQMTMLPRLKPRCFYDLVIEVAIVRPGPIQGKMVHPYLRRRQGLEPIDYPSPAVRAVLEKTLGVPLFQEQAMKLAMVAAGFTAGEADQLRRAMAAWRRPGMLDTFRPKLLSGLRDHGLTEEYANRIFEQLRGFGEYGFPESHAASFALLVYISAWIKCHYPAVFTTALLNSQPMGFYAPAQLVRDARQHGVQVLPVDINESEWDCTLTSVDDRPRWALRLGLRMVHGLRHRQAMLLTQVRQQGGRFTDWENLIDRVRLHQASLLLLAQADAFGSLALGRREAIWQALAYRAEEYPLFDTAVGEEVLPSLPPLAPAEEVLADYRATGLSLRNHPLAFVREELTSAGVVPNERLAKCPTGTLVQVAGVVLVRQRPATAKGITFVTLEDETGLANLVVRPETWERYRQAARRARALIATGRVERQGMVIHVLTEQLENITDRLVAIPHGSRDFH